MNQVCLNLPRISQHLKIFDLNCLILPEVRILIKILDPVQVGLVHLKVPPQLSKLLPSNLPCIPMCTCTLISLAAPLLQLPLPILVPYNFPITPFSQPPFHQPCHLTPIRAPLLTQLAREILHPQPRKQNSLQELQGANPETGIKESHTQPWMLSLSQAVHII